MTPPRGAVSVCSVECPISAADAPLIASAHTDARPTPPSIRWRMNKRTYRPLPSAARPNELLSYDPTLGVLRWKVIRTGGANKVEKLAWGKRTGTSRGDQNAEHGIANSLWSSVILGIHILAKQQLSALQPILEVVSLTEQRITMADMQWSLQTSTQTNASKRGLMIGAAFGAIAGSAFLVAAYMKWPTHGGFG